MGRISSSQFLSLSPPQELDITAFLAIPLFLATYIGYTAATFYRTPIAQPPTDGHRFKARYRPFVVSVSIDRRIHAHKHAAQFLHEQLGSRHRRTTGNNSALNSTGPDSTGHSPGRDPPCAVHCVTLRLSCDASLSRRLTKSPCSCDILATSWHRTLLGAIQSGNLTWRALSDFKLIV